MVTGISSARGRRADSRDELDQFVESVAVLASYLHELARSLDDDAVGLGGRDGHAATASEIQQPLVAQCSQRSQDRVPVDAEDRGEIARRRQSVPRPGFAVGYRATDLSRDLFVQLGGLISAQLDVEDGASDTSFIKVLDPPLPSDVESPSDDLASAAAALFEEARRRSRRRRRTGAALALMAIALGIGLV